MKILQRTQKGFTIVTALFLLIILALIAAYMISISSLTQSSASLMVQGVRAYYAARSGLQWGIYKVAPLGGSEPFNCPTSPTTLTLTQGEFTGFTVVVTCSANSFTEGGVTYNVFQLTSTSSYSVPSSSDYVTRQLYTTVTQPGI